MRSRTLLAVAASLAVALPAAAHAGEPDDRATGGGQVFAGSEDGAGDTLAFSGRGTQTDARGELQYVDRTGGTGRFQETFHFDVLCVNVQGDRAELAGRERQTGNMFDLVVMDMGDGETDDTIMFNDNASNVDCDDEADNDDGQVDGALARGNAQVFDARP